MIYHEKQEELFKNYDRAITALNYANKKIAFTKGFEERGDLENDFNKTKEHKYA